MVFLRSLVIRKSGSLLNIASGFGFCEVKIKGYRSSTYKSGAVFIYERLGYIMKSRFVIKTEKEIVGANGVVIPPASIEGEIEYSLAEAGGMYDLYKKILRELPGMKNDIEKFFESISAGNCATEEKKCAYPEISTDVISVIESKTGIYIIKSIGEEMVKTICLNVPQCYDQIFVSKLVECILSLMEKDKQGYLYLKSGSETTGKIRDYVDEHPAVLKAFDEGFRNCRMGRVQFIPMYIDRYIKNLENRFYKS